MQQQIDRFDRSLDIIKRTYDLIKNGWVKGAYAKDAQGKQVDLYNDSACQFDLLGALQRARWELAHFCYEDIGYKKAYNLLLKLYKEVDKDTKAINLSKWNDMQVSSAAVLNLLKCAIDILQIGKNKNTIGKVLN